MTNALITHLVTKRKKASTAALARIVEAVAAAPFAADLLQVDAPLWGSFWQFDVISPGYWLPADELALLRAVRLDQSWPQDTSLEQFIDNLHLVVQSPQAGIWTLPVAGEPCVVFAGPSAAGHQLTVVWYCAATGKLHAGYRTEIGALRFEDAVEQRPLSLQIGGFKTSESADWLAAAVEEKAEQNATSVAARIDAEILRLRLPK